MKNLREAYVFCREICDDLNITIPSIITVCSKKMSGKWGQMTYNRMYNTYTVTINECLLSDDCDDKSLYDTLLHELLHTAPGCMNHGALWKNYAERINKAYNLNIKRTTSEEEKGVEVTNYKYALECPCCHHVWKFVRMTKTVKDPSSSWCGTCGEEKGKLIRIK